MTTVRWAGVLVVAAVSAAVDVRAGIILQPEEADSQDVFVYEFLPTFNFETSGPQLQAILATSENTIGHTTRTLIGFDLSSVPFDAEDVTEATLNLYAIDGEAIFQGAFRNPNPGAAADVQAWVASEAWVEDEVTWATQPGAGALAGSTVVDDVEQWVRIDVTQAVRDWLSGAEPNYGFVVRMAEEVRDPDTGAVVGVVYDSSSAMHKPFLEIVPEPATVGLVLGGVVAAGRRRASRRGRAV